jgi:hypothetical protein
VGVRVAQLARLHGGDPLVQLAAKLLDLARGGTLARLEPLAQLAAQRVQLTRGGSLARLHGGQALAQRVGVGGIGLLAQGGELGAQRLDLLGGAGGGAQRLDLLGEAGEVTARSGVGLLEPGHERP